MSKTKSWIYDLQEKYGFREDENGNVVINWDITKSVQDGKFVSTQSDKEEQIKNFKEDL